MFNSPSTPGMKRKASNVISGVSPKKARERPSPSNSEPNGVHFGTIGQDLDSVKVAPATHRSFRKRRLNEATNWLHLLPSLIYPLMTVLPSAQDPSGTLRPWKSTTLASCQNGCSSKMAKIQIISFGCMFRK